MTACTQPGCSGTILDGYCDVCGMPGGSAAAGGSSRGSTGSTGSTGEGLAGLDSASTASRASSRLASAAIGSALSAALGRGSATQRRGTSSTRLRAARLGAGLTAVPPQPAVDAASALMSDPEVAEHKRFCPTCGSPVGRSIEGRPGRTEGFCPQCRSPFSFTPKLAAGDLVGGQYEVAGALAHGGMGWIYLAQDRNVSDRWVVLKGLLNAGDPDALAAAIAERQFLAQVEHPLIVEIYNFVTHEGSGYIVMEYVGGTSLKSILKDRMKAAGRYDPLPLDQAIAYVLEVLPAFGYLHDLGLIYCDFKPDNIIQVGDAVKLIDLGGVRRMTDLDSAIYGTVGYQAPEVPEVGPSIAGDIYTIGRSLLVLAMEFRGYQSRYVTSLPSVAETPLFQQHDSFYRLVAKACAPDPADRFASAAELRVQLLGVLREVVAAGLPKGSAPVHAAPSVHFEVPRVADSTLDWRVLPGLVSDTDDPQVGWLTTVSVEDPLARLEALEDAPERSPEVLIETARTALLADRPDLVGPLASELLAADPWDWRAVWLQGLTALETGNGSAAQAAFNAVYGQVPGELAPKLALALACESSNEPDIAEGLYITCARSDAAYTAPAAFALARIRVARGDMAGAVEALDLVPPTSRAYTEARRRRAALLAASGGDLPTLAAALASVEGVRLDTRERAELTVEVLRAALGHVLRHGADPTVQVGGYPAAEPALRDGLELAFRELATRATSKQEKVVLVDEANEVRQWTLR